MSLTSHERPLILGMLEAATDTTQLVWEHYAAMGDYSENRHDLNEALCRLRGVLQRIKRDS